ncbi:hypothetical protein BCV69DRAFT_146288 [Microstroma glucosiphilum]|uniref:E2 ubiquitin-conjugating enzyme n=1 Tax=Pseudomicrostroma glucosiphilum TaxID=1684307 RepID=A0A316UBI3_9BASI|nr:hypothetical protein BCV69DRAFT_146288 [Pseudomicrostroma glucosiphilum]PWN22519.1 hypothetical protein BCV69DRAFT_146288 [Pseudomicrostroma glucosiphilum]
MAPPSSTMKRLIKEVRSLQANPPDCVRVQVDDCDVTDIRGWVQGPPGTPFASGYFLITFSFPSEFPSVPPRCLMSTRIFHPNVSISTGEICVSTLKKDWSPEYGIGHVLTVIKCLLISPNPDSALNAEAGRLLQENYEEYAATARLWTSVHAASCPVGMFEPAALPVATQAIAPPLQRSLSDNASKVLNAAMEDKVEKTGATAGAASSSASSVPSKTAPPTKKVTAAKRGVKRL